jgi:hypothetical protein
MLQWVPGPRLKRDVFLLHHPPQVTKLIVGWHNDDFQDLFSCLGSLLSMCVSMLHMSHLW